MFVIIVKDPARPVVYFSKNGGYTSNANDAESFTTSADANATLDVLLKASSYVHKYGSVTEKT